MNPALSGASTEACHAKGADVAAMLLQVHPWFPPEADLPMEDKSFLI